MTGEHTGGRLTARMRAPELSIRIQQRPVLVLATGVALAAVSALLVSSSIEGQVEARLEERVDRIAAVLDLQLRQYEATSRAVVAVVQQASSQTEFADRVAELGLSERLPGMYALNSTVRVEASQVAAFEEQQRASGTEGFAVRPRPAGDGAPLFVIDRVSPFERNQVALGFDVTSNPDAAVAVRRAVSTGDPSLSDALTLTQEPDDQTALVLYAPWYDDLGALAGVTSVAIRGQDFLDALSLGDVGVTLTDPSTASGARLIGSLDPDEPDPDGLVTERTVELYGQSWDLVVAAPAGFASAAERSAPATIPLAILVLSVVSAGLVSTLERGEERARELVVERTRELVALNGRLQDAIAAKNEFLAVLGHEFRTPLTVIRGFAATLRAGRVGPVSDGVSGVLDRIEWQAAKLDELVDDLLIAANLQQRRVSARPELVDLDRLLDEVASTHQEHLGPIHISCSSDLIVEVDRAHALRIFSALLSNAAKYGVAPVDLEARGVHDMVEVRVTDSGAGVDPEQRDAIFDAFWQADSGSTRRSQGVGLGLAIVRELCQQNGGSVELDATRGPGACFVVRLPRFGATTDVASPEHVLDDQR